MKKWAGAIVFFLSLSLLFFSPANAAGASVDALKGDNHFGRSFAVINGGNYYVSNGMLGGQTYGIYKVSNDMQGSRMIRKGNFTNIAPYKNTVVTFDEDQNILQRFSLDGSLVREYPEVKTSYFVIENDQIFYSDDKKIYQIGINGKNNRLLYRADNFISEFTIHNGWLYFSTVTQLGKDPASPDIRMSLARVKIANPAQTAVLVKNVYNIDSFIVQNGSVYAVIHKTANISGRDLYRMDYSGNQLKRLPNINTQASFIGSKYIYSVDNSMDDRQKLYSTALDGRNVQLAGVLPGRVVSAEHHDGKFYFQIQDHITERYFLYRMIQRR